MTVILRHEVDGRQASDSARSFSSVAMARLYVFEFWHYPQGKHSNVYHIIGDCDKVVETLHGALDREANLDTLRY